MWGGGGAGRLAKAIARTANRINRRPRRRRVTTGDQHPAGPKLIAGRGKPRRRSGLGGALALAFYITLAAALVLLFLEAWGPR